MCIMADWCMPVRNSLWGLQVVRLVSGVLEVTCLWACELAQEVEMQVTCYVSVRDWYYSDEHWKTNGRQPCISIHG